MSTLDTQSQENNVSYENVTLPSEEKEDVESAHAHEDGQLVEPSSDMESNAPSPTASSSAVVEAESNVLSRMREESEQRQAEKIAMTKQQLLQCFGKLLNVLPRKNRELRDLIAVFNTQVSSAEASVESKEKEKTKDSNSSPIDSADPYWTVFKQACDTNLPHVIEVALDCIQKLLATSILTGSIIKTQENIIFNTNKQKGSHFKIKPPSPPPPSLSPLLALTIFVKDANGEYLIDDIVRTICNCDRIDSDKVHLQKREKKKQKTKGSKSILTLGTSPTCEVHGQSLLLCMRSCYNIYLTTKNVDVQTSGAFFFFFFFEMCYLHISAFECLCFVLNCKMESTSCVDPDRLCSVSKDGEIVHALQKKTT
ncbi:hypothetical protein RFI_24239 [Reticulomyxa filosa]|uniref:Mon2/Sec7/BIG1-like dimerisation and cyclophilin-binding domain-containing protein n=1 Tax=Reticulomyxa filosa TaxID=46433 RepID=X6MJ87_RETFI|nr:hypothetical protein RFI_24239 [Reticulomyxa filosa]|eukprot:ETO13135.1 hypothetical protein RFI_24239 [Reticulomyxa filosa]